MIDLSCWNWTGPKVDPKTKKLYRLETHELCQALIDRRGVENQLDFGTDDFGDYMEYIAESGLPDTGTTENTKYPRSELRQTLTNGAAKQANWTPPLKPQSMRARLRIMSLADARKAIIGQIHGDPSENPPLKIQITRDTVYAQLRRQHEGVEDKPVLGKFEEGVPFTYRVDVFSDYSVDIYFNEKLVIERYQFDAATYAEDTWYWKAGMYSQTDAKKGKGVSVVRFYMLEVVPILDKVRTLGDVSYEVDMALSGWQTGMTEAQTALDVIQRLKVEADTDFERSAERSAVYDKIVAARALIRQK